MTSTARNESGSGATVTPLVAGTDIERLEKRAEQYLRRSKRTPTDHTHVCFGSITEVAAPNFDFRFTPESGLNSDAAPCPRRADFVAKVS
jgi:hypothetical protein